MTQILTQENNQENSQDLEHEEWFAAFQNKWFLSKKSKAFLPGKDSWFVNPLQTAKIVHKASIKKRADMSNIKIELTKDPELLRQYYDLREGEYRNKNGWVEYDGSENDFDKKANIVVAIDNNKVIAGFRASIPDTGYLSNEDPEKNFTYKEICKSRGINLEGSKYVEISAIVVQPNSSNFLLGSMLKGVITDCSLSGVEYVFGVSTSECNRDYRTTLKKIGFESIIIETIEAPRKSKYNSVPMYPIIVMTKPKSIK